MDVLKYLCHRRPERSFFYRGRQFPVCSRCTGIIVGSVFFMVYSFIVPINYGWNMFYLSVILQLPYIVDGFTQYLNWRQSNNILRFITGFLGGIGVVLLARLARVAVEYMLMNMW
ncbi:MAG: hypothetical protein BZ137_02450 [Methanosphaera sp. rholeuAM130]|nr:DUF2085 domain-containing protein [Methanosphaera sp.]RAP54387.1 MAG: hypothetical protein BZ137_02450 [Methanosphaera sp. rholeuAM130]